MTIRSRMGLVNGSKQTRMMGNTFPLSNKIAKFDFVYMVASVNINQSGPNFVTMYMTIGSWISFIMGLIGPEQL